MRNIFKRKKKAVDNPGNYDWSFNFVEGGFCTLKSLCKYKKPRHIYALYWLGGFKFKFFKLYKSHPKPNEAVNENLYSTILKFDTLKDFIDL